jgi:outer membrane immunogenic protein
MKKTIMAMAIATTASGSAAAADLPRGPAPYYPPPASVYNWTGPYAGLNLGYEWGKVTNNVTEPSGIAGGGQIGYNRQMGQFVFGVETDIQASGADDTFAPYKFSNPWFGTLRGRAGFAINNVMLYGTAGLAYGELKGEFFGLEEDKTLVGWSAGPLARASSMASPRTGPRSSSTCTWILAAAPTRSLASTMACTRATCALA